MGVGGLLRQGGVHSRSRGGITGRWWARWRGLRCMMRSPMGGPNCKQLAGQPQGRPAAGCSCHGLLLPGRLGRPSERPIRQYVGHGRADKRSCRSSPFSSVGSVMKTVGRDHTFGGCGPMPDHRPCRSCWYVDAFICKPCMHWGGPRNPRLGGASPASACSPRQWTTPRRRSLVPLPLCVRVQCTDTVPTRMPPTTPLQGGRGWSRKV